MYCEKLMHLGEFLVAHEVSLWMNVKRKNMRFLFEEI
jgi:hypothetical protein